MKRQSEPVGTQGTAYQAETQGPAWLWQSGEGRDRVSVGLGDWWAKSGKSHLALGPMGGP